MHEVVSLTEILAKKRAAMQQPLAHLPMVIPLPKPVDQISVGATIHYFQDKKPKGWRGLFARKPKPYFQIELYVTLWRGIEPEHIRFSYRFATVFEVNKQISFEKTRVLGEKGYYAGFNQTGFPDENFILD